MQLLKFHVIGEFPRGSVVAEWVEDSRVRLIDVEARIAFEWEMASRRPGVKLFDGPMCRLESFDVAEKLSLRLSRTSYRIFMGTNLTHPEFEEACRANPLGLSSALQTADGFLMLGRRNARVAYYPSRIHPFAGALEPREKVDVFEEIERELDEELGLKPSDFSQITCLGMAEDVSVRQPELIFRAVCKRARVEIEAQLDEEEHASAVAIPADAQSIESTLRDPVLTPIACATLLLWGRWKWGTSWFDTAQRVPSNS